MRKANLYLIAAAVATALMAVSLWLAGCGDKPTQPPKPKEPKDYVFYFNDSSYPERFYRYHSVTRKIDSLTTPYGSHSSFAVSHDGSLLYLCDGYQTRVVTSDSLQLVDELPPGYISVSPNGQYVAIAGPDSIVIIQTDNDSTVYTDTFNFLNGRFSNDSQTYYGNGQHHLLTVRLTDPVQISDRTFTGGGVYRFVVSPDDKELYLYVFRASWDFLFAVIDVVRDSIVFQEPITPGVGDIEITPDGRYVFYTSPGTVLIGPDSSPYLTVYDTERNAIHKLVSIVDYALVRNLAISPDGRRLMAVGGPGIPSFFVLDVATRMITQLYDLGDTDPWNVACQNGL